MIALETAVNKLGIDPVILELIKLRASQINGWACSPTCWKVPWFRGLKARRL